MVYRFTAEIQSGRGKVSREDRYEINQYLSEVQVEAEDKEKAYKLLSKKIAGRLSRESTAEEAQIALPDYGSDCLVKVRAYAEN